MTMLENELMRKLDKAIICKCQCNGNGGEHACCCLGELKHRCYPPVQPSSATEKKCCLHGETCPQPPTSKCGYGCSTNWTSRNCIVHNIPAPEPPCDCLLSDSGQKHLCERHAISNKTKENQVKNKAVLVTTEFRGVFFGYVKDDKNLPDEITLTGVRNCIYWSSDCGGFLGLASGGPTSGCKISAKVDELRLFKITSVTPVTDEAAKKWNS